MLLGFKMMAMIIWSVYTYDMKCQSVILIIEWTNMNWMGNICSCLYWSDGVLLNCLSSKNKNKNRNDVTFVN